MNRRNKIIYWVAIIWLSLGMTSSAIVQLIKMKEEVEMFNQLGFPVYLLSILAVWKLLGVVTILLPRFPLLKEWAYAGFFFLSSGAALSHIVSGHTVADIAPALLLLLLTVVSWYFRPADKRLMGISLITST